MPACTSGINGLQNVYVLVMKGFGHDKFNIDGIPSYVLVDKKGDYCMRNDLRDHNKYKNTIFEMIK